MAIWDRWDANALDFLGQWVMSMFNRASVGLGVIHTCVISPKNWKILDHRGWMTGQVHQICIRVTG